MSFSDDHGSTLLGTSRPSGTGSASIYSPAANRYAVITKIMIIEVAGGTTAASVFVDPDGTTYDQSTTLQFALPSTAFGVRVYDFDDGWEIGEDGNVAVQSATGNAHNYIVLGREFDL